MTDIFYFDRKSRSIEKEKVYGHFFLEILYGKGLLAKFFSFFLRPFFSKIPFLSKAYGSFQKSRLSRFKVVPFISSFHVDTSEFLDPVSSFSSFNSFFTRKLKPACRPFASGNEVAILPADARYLVFSDIKMADGFWIKGKQFTLRTLLKDDSLTDRFLNGAMVIARLCPTDYHRFHFPTECVPGEPRLINGPLYSVNPLALKYNSDILCENKRVVTLLKTDNFGLIAYIEVGATYVGSICQTYTPGKTYAKGGEKGYFSFGGSTLILLFEPGKIAFDSDLIESSLNKIEVRGLLGQSLGKSRQL